MHFMRGGRAATKDEIVEIIDVCRRAGIFAVRDMGHRTGVGLEAKKIARGRLDVKTAGYALSRSDGYGAFLGRQVSTEKELRTAVKEVAASGADFIKVINSGIVSFSGNASVTGGGFSLAELKAICSEARERKLAVACHANSERAIRDAVLAGVSSVEHGFFISAEILHMMAGKGVSWTPTIFALAAFSNTLSPPEKKYLDELVERHLESLSYAASVGVRLNVGTDSGSQGVRHGESFIEELRFFRRAGLSSEEMFSFACMERSEIERGSYLLVGRDFIADGKIVAVYEAGKLLFQNN